MSFLTGLVTGAAQSISGNLQAALDRRQEELSRARQFWRARQAQKADLADAHDRRASKALNRFINEFDGNIAKGLAAYKAVGGDVDAAEAYIKNLDDTRMVGLDYDINEKFKFDNIDLEQFADLSRKDALGSISMDVKPISASAFKDTSNLGKIGLGLKDAGKGISDDINKLVPPRKKQVIEGLIGATFDPSGTKSAMQFQMDKQKFEMQMKNSVGNLEKQYNYLTYEISQLDPITQADEILNLEKQQGEILSAVSSFELAKKSATDKGLSTSLTAQLISKRKDEFLKSIQYGRAGEQLSIVVDGEVITGEKANKRFKELQLQEHADIIENTLLTPSGDWQSSDKEALWKAGQFVDGAYELAMKNINTRMGKVKEEDETKIKTEDKTKIETTDTTETKVVGKTDFVGELPKAQENVETVDMGGDEFNYVVGVNNTVISGKNQTEATNNLYKYIGSNPKDYFDGIVKEFGEDFIVENLKNYKTIIDGAARRIQDEELKQKFIEETDAIIANLPKTLGAMQRSMSAMNVMTLPQGYQPKRVQKLLSDRGEFSGQYLYEDDKGVQYVSPENPNKFGLEVQ